MLELLAVSVLLPPPALSLWHTTHACTYLWVCVVVCAAVWLWPARVTALRVLVCAIPLLAVLPALLTLSL